MAPAEADTVAAVTDEATRLTIIFNAKGENGSVHTIDISPL
jgi:hypothetical protein